MPSVTPKKLVQTLKKFGFFEHRQRGTSHLVMVHPDGRRAVIAMHHGADIPNGTLRGILRDIEISPKELAKLL